MRISLTAAILGSLAVQSAAGVRKPCTQLKVLMGNDDGWAEANIRAFYQTLTAAGYKAVISSPVQDQSGTGSSDAPAPPLAKAGRYGTVPAGAPAQGANATDPRLNYVNSYPVTAIKYGLDTLSPKFFHGLPDIVVSGPNVGYNLGSDDSGVSTEAVKRGLPAIAFSTKGWVGGFRPYTTLQAGDSSFVYAQVAQRLIATLTATAKPWLPNGINVNIPDVSSTCAKASDFKFVLTRLYWTSDSTDVVTCNNHGRLADEGSVVGGDGCYVTVSVLNASKGDASMEQQNGRLKAAWFAQAAVLAKLSSLLVCAAGR
ncbi:hypothetical protein FRC10_002279 [Ceratobasidium sp. 414]|nr:hypothetical protein FRC10_002279 [Ceratobasidium sp. 414]